MRRDHHHARGTPEHAARFLDARVVVGLGHAVSLSACGFIGFASQPTPSPGDAAVDAGVEAGTFDAMLEDAMPSDAGMLDSGFDAAPPELEGGTATQVTDYCAEVPALPSNPMIDGQLDGALNLVALEPQGWRSSDDSPLPDHTTAEYAVAWRPEGLYVFVRVTDPNRLPAPTDQTIWQGDGIEVYVDDDGSFAAAPAYDNPGTIQLIVAAPVDAVTPSTRATRFRDTAGVGAWTSTRFGSFPTESGYVLEALITAEALDLSSLQFSTGSRVGFDLGVNVSALDTELDAGLMLETFRLGQYFLRAGGESCGGSPFCTVQAFCTPTLID